MSERNWGWPFTISFAAAFSISIIAWLFNIDGDWAYGSEVAISSVLDSGEWPELAITFILIPLIWYIGSQRDIAEYLDTTDNLTIIGWILTISWTTSVLLLIGPEGEISNFQWSLVTTIVGGTCGIVSVLIDLRQAEVNSPILGNWAGGVGFVFVSTIFYLWFVAIPFFFG